MRKILNVVQLFSFLCVLFNAYSLNDDTEDIVGLKLINNGQNLYKFEELTIGNNQSFKNIYYDTQNQDSFIGMTGCLKCKGKTFDPTFSKTLYNYNTKGKVYYAALGFNVSGNYASDNFTIDFSKYSINSTFLLVDNIDSDNERMEDGVLGLGYTYEKHLMGINASFIDQLMIVKGIKNKIIVQELENSTGKLFIGGVPPRISNSVSNNYTFCKIPNGLLNWGCELSYIIAGNNYDLSRGLKYLNNKSIAVFSTFEPNIIAPYSALSYFERFYLNEFNCSKGKKEAYIYFLCNFNDSFSKDVNIVFNDFAYKIEYRDLFTVKQNGTIFNILFVSSEIDSDQWTIGQIFLKNYQVVFDANKNIIGFYGGFKFNLKTSFWFWMNLCIALGLFIFIIVLIGVIRHKRRNHNEILYKFQGDQVFLPTSTIHK